MKLRAVNSYSLLFPFSFPPLASPSHIVHRHPSTSPPNQRPIPSRTLTPLVLFTVSARTLTIRSSPGHSLSFSRCFSTRVSRGVVSPLSFFLVFLSSCLFSRQKGTLSDPFFLSFLFFFYFCVLDFDLTSVFPVLIPVHRLGVHHFSRLF